MHYDVLVIGGGPAGSTTALRLARAGAAVAVLERTHFDTRRVGELASPAAAAVLQSIGVWPAFVAGRHQPVAHVVTSWGPGEATTDFLANPFGNAWVVERGQFDRLLFEAAGDAGADTHWGTVARGCQRRNDVWVTQAIQNGRVRQLTARYLVDATGRTRGLQTGARSTADRLVGCLCYIEPPPRPATDAPLPIVESTEQGWWFTTALPSGTRLVAYFTDADLLPRDRQPAIAHFWRQLECAPLVRAQLPASQARYAFHRCAAHSEWRATSAPNRLAVGDALMAMDPLSGAGVATALESGWGEASAIIASAQGDARALARWQQARRQRYEQYLRERDTQYRVEPRWRGSSFWQRRHETF